jgi:hypothetical protein
VFGAQARFRKEWITVQGQSNTYVRTGDEGTRATFHFCFRCGATVYYELEGMDEFLAIPVGAFADSTFPTPTFSVYEERMHAWVVLPDNIEHMD